MAFVRLVSTAVESGDILLIGAGECLTASTFMGRCW
jgi:hypothetical protein